mgnify:CR=1 FL=1
MPGLQTDDVDDDEDQINEESPVLDMAEHSANKNGERRTNAGSSNLTLAPVS